MPLQNLSLAKKLSAVFFAKKILIFVLWFELVLLSIFSNPVIAKNYSSVQAKTDGSEILLEKKFQRCLGFIDLKDMEYFENKGFRLKKEIQLLCKRKDRNAAQNLAIGFSIEIHNSESMSSFKQCSKLTTESRVELRKMLKTYFISTLRFEHVCDMSN